MSKEKVSSEGIKEGIIKIIDGEPYYHYKYTDYLYQEIKKVNKEIERLNNIIYELEEELEREINFGKTIPKEADNYNSSLDIRHTLEKVLERLKELKEGKENE